MKKIFISIIISIFSPTLGMLSLGKIRQALVYFLVSGIAYICFLTNVLDRLNIHIISVEKVMFWFRIAIFIMVITHILIMFRRKQINDIKNYYVSVSTILVLLKICIGFFIIHLFTVVGNVPLIDSKKIIPSGSVVLVVDKNYYEMASWIKSKMYGQGNVNAITRGDVVLYTNFLSKYNYNIWSVGDNEINALQEKYLFSDSSIIAGKVVYYYSK